MSVGWPKRVARILIAVAFLVGGLAGGSMPVALAASANPVGVGGAHAMPMPEAAASAEDCCEPGAVAHPGHGTKPADTAHQHTQCLAVCGTACTLLADLRVPTLGAAWFTARVRHLSPATAALRGITHEPPLFPPIA